MNRWLTAIFILAGSLFCAETAWASDYHFHKGYTALQAGNRSEAAKWFFEAAEKGHPQSQVSLGILYSFGMGVAKDHAQAVKWHRKAAQSGNAEGQVGLE